jgi:hypothetical protein
MNELEILQSEIKNTLESIKKLKFHIELHKAEVINYRKMLKSEKLKEND